MPDLATAVVRPDVDLAAKVAFLSDPRSFAAGPASVESIETHMAWVFLAGPDAYKLKKPVRYPFLDFSTADARRVDCEAEVRLNQSLAPGVYRGVVPLLADDAGRLHVGGCGTAVDWLVHMRRLPGERMLDRLIEAGRVDRSDLVRLGNVLAAFYRSARRVYFEPGEYARRFEREVGATRDALADPRYALPTACIGAIAEALARYLYEHGAVLEARARAGRIVEGHGDLRPEHVCLENPPVVIDCIEFNRDFRLLDPFDELAYLTIECERLGAPGAGRLVGEQYQSLTGDLAPSGLTDFYMGFRAQLRAKIAAWHVHDPSVRPPNKWLDRARQYLRLAARHAGCGELTA